MGLIAIITQYRHRPSDFSSLLQISRVMQFFFFFSIIRFLTVHELRARKKKRNTDFGRRLGSINPHASSSRSDVNSGNTHSLTLLHPHSPCLLLWCLRRHLFGVRSSSSCSNWGRSSRRRRRRLL